MPAQPQLPQGGGDPFADFVNKNNYIPVWLHPHVAAGVIRHFGKDGSAIVHPHPSLQAGQNGMADGGTIPPSAVLAGRRAAPTGQIEPAVPPAAAPPMAPAAASGAPLAGIPAGIGAAGAAGRSIFGGGPVGQGGPQQRVPVFAQAGTAIDARGGAKVPGVPPAPDDQHDTVPAMLDPGEAVFNKKQLAGIKVKPGKEHLVRPDQKKAMRNARRK